MQHFAPAPRLQKTKNPGKIKTLIREARFKWARKKRGAGKSILHPKEGINPQLIEEILKRWQKRENAAILPSQNIPVVMARIIEERRAEGKPVTKEYVLMRMKEEARMRGGRVNSAYVLSTKAHMKMTDVAARFVAREIASHTAVALRLNDSERRTVLQLVTPINEKISGTHLEMPSRVVVLFAKLINQIGKEKASAAAELILHNYRRIAKMPPATFFSAAHESDIFKNLLSQRTAQMLKTTHQLISADSYNGKLLIEDYITERQEIIPHILKNQKFKNKKTILGRLASEINEAKAVLAEYKI